MRNLVVFAVICAMLGCKSPDTVRRMDGIVVDTTTNTIIVQKFDSEDQGLYEFNIEYADLDEAYGLLAGNRVKVEYNDTSEGIVNAVKVSANRTYARAVGHWTMPDPADSLKRVGLDIGVWGKAKSIGQGSLIYSAWEPMDADDHIALKGQEIDTEGNVADITQDAYIMEEQNRLFLRIDGTDMVYEKENEI